MTRAPYAVGDAVTMAFVRLHDGARITRPAVVTRVARQCSTRWHVTAHASGIAPEVTAYVREDGASWDGSDAITRAQLT